MPVYEYRCEGCKKQFEVICKFSEKDEKKPECDCDDPYVKQIVTSGAKFVPSANWRRHGKKGSW